MYRVKGKQVLWILQENGHVVEDWYSKNKYGKECTYCHKKGHEERSSGRKKKMTKNNYKNYVTEYIYHDELFFGDDALACENKTTNKEIEKMFVSESGSTSRMVNSLKVWQI